MQQLSVGADYKNGCQELEWHDIPDSLAFPYTGAHLCYRGSGSNLKNTEKTIFRNQPKSTDPSITQKIGVYFMGLITKF
jgi:hypothetical protein